MSDKYKILFVCLGNICRSPAAEGIFRQMVEKRGLGEKLEADSAGTYAGHTGEQPDSHRGLMYPCKHLYLNALPLASIKKPRDWHV